MGKGF